MQFPKIYSALFIVLMVAGTALGSEESGRFSISPMIGSYTLGNPAKSYSTTKPTVEVKGGYNLNEYVGLELNIAYAQTRTSSNDHTLLKYGGDVLLHLLPEGDFVPFLALGGGGMNYLESNRGVSTSVRSFIGGGGGIKYQLTDSIALRMDGRINIIASTSELKQLVLLAGIHIPFGATKSAAKVPESGAAATAQQTKELNSVSPAASSSTPAAAVTAVPVDGAAPAAATASTAAATPTTGAAPSAPTAAAAGTQTALVPLPQPEPAQTAIAAAGAPLIQETGTAVAPGDSAAGTAPVAAESVLSESTEQKAVVTDINIGKNHIDILFDRPVADYKTLELDKPERLAIFLQSTAWGLAKRFIAIKRFGISNIRIGSYPDSVTIVLDSPETAFPSYTVEKLDTGLRINFTSKATPKVKAKLTPAPEK